MSHDSHLKLQEMQRRQGHYVEHHAQSETPPERKLKTITRIHKESTNYHKDSASRISCSKACGTEAFSIPLGEYFTKATALMFTINQTQMVCTHVHPPWLSRQTTESCCISELISRAQLQLWQFCTTETDIGTNPFATSKQHGNTFSSNLQHAPVFPRLETERTRRKCWLHTEAASMSCLERDPICQGMHSISTSCWAVYQATKRGETGTAGNKMKSDYQFDMLWLGFILRSVTETPVQTIAEESQWRAWQQHTFRRRNGTSMRQSAQLLSIYWKRLWASTSWSGVLADAIALLPQERKALFEALRA